MKKITIALAAPILAFVLQPSIAGAETLKYVGSSTVGKFIADAGKVYAGTRITSNTRPESSGGESCPASGSCDIGGVARAVKSQFLDKGVVPTLIGKDAIAVIVHRDNPVKALTTAQLKGIFTGKIKNWSELGGPDLAINAYVVKKGSATRKVFANKVLGGAKYQGAKVVTPDAKMVTTVIRDKGAIGQISFAFLSGKKAVVAVAINGQAATVENPDYPITRPLHLTTKGTPQGEAKAFIAWALSPAGQKVVKQRFVGVN
ncbi:MAG: phosphate ABC transporter substrate-binding protein [Alphaproteobacteria bacterium]|nr:phosphate ABC transporter substrate-binding protein [Alphaproteobacteria bacterium]MDP6563985.1 phosphate ABC transporter substrate-binding protein [Alphaproteobacteria bacterium]